MGRCCSDDANGDVSQESELVVTVITITFEVGLLVAVQTPGAANCVTHDLFTRGY